MTAAADEDRQLLRGLRDHAARRAQRWGFGRDQAERLAALEARLAALEGAKAGEVQQMASLQHGLAEGLEGDADLAAKVASHHAWLLDLERWVSSCVRTLANLGSQPLDGAEPSASGEVNVLGSVMARLQVATVMDWIANVGGDLDDGPLVSVAMATRNRPDQVRDALHSVLGQSYGNVEVVVIDDSDGEETWEALRAVTDERLRPFRAPARRGAGAAFNLGLEHASGDIITFLDDDNQMHPEWVRSVVWAFTTFPEAQSMYGARSNEDPGAERGVRSGMLPTLEFAPYDRARHERANYIDRNTIALRSSLAHLRYDETLPAALDWEYSLRLFALAGPMPLPALSCYYRTVGRDRISDLPGQPEAVRTVRARTHTTRPLRVLVDAGSDHEIPPSGRHDDVDVLVEAGDLVSVVPLENAALVARGVHAEPDAGATAEAVPPDVLLIHGEGRCEELLPVLSDHALPFGCRVESVGPDEALLRRILGHAQCIGVVANSGAAARSQPGVRILSGNLHATLQDLLTSWRSRGPSSQQESA